MNLRNSGLPLLVAIIFVAIVFYWPGMASLLSAWNRPEYSHGYIIPIIALIIGLKRYQTQPNTESNVSSTIAITIVLFAIILGVLGKMAGIADIITYGMLFSIAGLAILILGLKSAFRLWPAWFYLAFMLPLPNFIYWPLSIKLQFLSSQIGVQIIKLFGVPVFLEGNIIDLGTYQLQVAEACSGLRYLFPLMSFGFLFATLYRGPAWQKCLIFVATIPITIFMNSARIGVIGFLVDRYGIKQAEGFLHFFEGWVVYAICIFLLVLLVITLQKITGSKKPMSEALDLSMQGMGDKLKRLSLVPYSNSFWLILTAFVFAILTSATLLSRLSIHPQRDNFDKFPMEVNGWTGKRAFLDFETERVLAADDYIQVDYSDPTGATHLPVNFLVSYYKSQTEGSGIHSPEVCIPAGGWEVSKWEQASIKLDVLKNIEFKVNRAIIQKENERQLVYYWFEQRGRRITNDYVAKGYTVLDSIVRGRSDGALIRVTTPIDENASIAEAEDRLSRFLELAMGKIPDFVPP